MLDDLQLVSDCIAERRMARLSEEWIADWRRRIHFVLEHGTGVLFWHSAAFSKLSKAEFTDATIELCDLIGVRVAVNPAGELLNEVRDTGLTDTPTKPARGHLTSEGLAFHTDRADLTALFCWSPAETGGLFRICSAAALVGMIESDHAELRGLLERPIPHDLRDGASGGDTFIYLPILTQTTETFVLRYVRRFNESVVRHGISLDPAVAGLLNAIDGVIANRELAGDLQLERGSIVICNNHTTLHARTAFIDSDEKRRALLRCWMSSEYTRRLPEAFRPVFGSVLPGHVRGGFVASSRA